MVRAVGIEPTLLAELYFESSASTNFTTPAHQDAAAISLARAVTSAGADFLSTGVDCFARYEAARRDLETVRRDGTIDGSDNLFDIATCVANDRMTISHRKRSSVASSPRKRFDRPSSNTQSSGQS